jgi:hypothetical protein
MKNSIRIAVAGALIALGAAQIYAAPATRIGYRLTIAMSGAAQGTTTTNSNGTVMMPAISEQITTRLVILSLAAGLNTNFSAGAILFFTRPIGSDPNAISGFFVRDTVDGTAVDFDVTPFFIFSNSMVVQNSATRSNGVITGQQASFTEFIFQNTPITFDVAGWVLQDLGTGSRTATIAGTGTTGDGNTAVLRGTIAVSAGVAIP